MQTIYFRLVLLVLLMLNFSVEAQNYKVRDIKRHHKMTSWRPQGKKFAEMRYSFVGITLNSLHYYGDLSPTPSRLSTDLELTRPAIGLLYGTRIGWRFGLVSEFTYGQIRGSDNQSANPNDTDNGLYRYKRNASFKNNIKELSVTLRFDLKGYHGYYIHRNTFTPHVYAGVAVFHHNPLGKVPAQDIHGNNLPHAGKWIPLQPLGTEGQFANLNPADANFGIKPYKRIQLSIPVGIGGRIRLNNAIDFWFEAGFRYLFTDYIDDVSQNYVDLGVLESDLARSMSYRGYELNDYQNAHTYIGRDGVAYSVEAGYGQEHPDNVRGNKHDRDMIFVTSFKLTKIINARMHQAKSR